MHSKDANKVHSMIDLFDPTEVHELENLCEEKGYGRMLQLASLLWQRKDPVGSFVIGPCAAFVKECGCDYSCGKCYGCGWVVVEG